jgi:hypothetical protein
MTEKITKIQISLSSNMTTATVLQQQRRFADETYEKTLHNLLFVL